MRARVLSSKTLFLIGLIGLVLSFVYIAFFKNRELYPDTYTYLALTHWKTYATLYSGISVDYITLLKPLSWVISSLLAYNSIFTVVANILLLIACIVVLFYKRNIPSAVQWQVLLVFFCNGILLLYLGRASTEVFTVGFVILWLLFFDSPKKIIRYILTLTAVLLRTELFFIFLLKEKRFNVKLIASIIFLGFTGYIASVTGNLSLFILNIVFPTIAILAIEAVSHKHQWLERNSVKILTVIFTLWIICSLLSLISPQLLSTGIFAAGILSLPFLCFILLSTKEPNYEQKLELILKELLVLVGVYMLTASDSYRYFLFLVPLLTVELLPNQWPATIPRIKNITMIAACLAQVAILAMIFPFQAIQSNYWQERFQHINNTSETIFTATPLISTRLGFRSADICTISVESLPAGIYVIDEYANERCQKQIQAIQKILVAHKATIQDIYTTDQNVYLERYHHVGQTTTFYEYMISQ